MNHFFHSAGLDAWKTYTTDLEIIPGEINPGFATLLSRDLFVSCSKLTVGKQGEDDAPWSDEHPWTVEQARRLTTFLVFRVYVVSNFPLEVFS